MNRRNIGLSTAAASVPPPLFLIKCRNTVSSGVLATLAFKWLSFSHLESALLYGCSPLHFMVHFIACEAPSLRGALKKVNHFMVARPQYPI